MSETLLVLFNKISTATTLMNISSSTKSKHLHSGEFGAQMKTKHIHQSNLENIYIP